jgi:erythritol/L-threitol dehydrogenase
MHRSRRPRCERADRAVLEVPAAIRLIESGSLAMDKICTHQLPLTEFQNGLDLVASGAESVKVSLIP